MRRLTISKHEARLLCVLIIRPDEKRDYRTAKKVMQLDDIIRKANQEFDDTSEKMADNLKILQRRLKIKETPEDIEEFMHLDDLIGEQDKIATTEYIEVLFEDDLATLLNSLVKELRGIPVDRRNGRAFIRMFEAVEKMEKVKVTKAEATSDLDSDLNSDLDSENKEES